MQKVDLLFEELFTEAQKKAQQKKQADAKKGSTPSAIAKSSSRSHVSENRAAKIQLTKDLARLREEMNGPEPAQLTQVAKVMVLVSADPGTDHRPDFATSRRLAHYCHFPSDVEQCASPLRE